MFIELPTLVIDLIAEFLILKDLYHFSLICQDTSFLVNKIRNHPSIRAQWKRSFDMIQSLDQSHIEQTLLNTSLISFGCPPQSYWISDYHFLGIQLLWGRCDKSWYITIKPFQHETACKTIKIYTNSTDFTLTVSRDGKDVFFISTKDKITVRLCLHNFLVKKLTDTFIQVIRENLDFVNCKQKSCFGTTMKGINYDHYGNGLIWMNRISKSIQITNSRIFNGIHCQNSFHYHLFETFTKMFIYDFKRCLEIQIKRPESLLNHINQVSQLYYIKQFKSFYLIMTKSVYQLRLIEHPDDVHILWDKICKCDNNHIFCPFENRCVPIYKIKRL